MDAEDKILMMGYLFIGYYGIYPILWAQLMANMLEFNVQNRVEPPFIIIKNSSVPYCWQFVMLATAPHYFMLVSMVAIMMLEC